MYRKPFYITESVGNNAFSFDRRKVPRLYVPSVINGSLDDVQAGNEVVFEEYDDDGVLHSCTGLRHFVKLAHPHSGKPIVVVDCHNHVFYFWYEASKQGLFQPGIQLLHIDAHRDTRVPGEPFTPEQAANLDSVFDYTNYTLNVGNYIPPAMDEGLIGSLISITGERELYEARPESPYILNLDLDFWAQGNEFIDEAATMAVVKPLALGAELITIATSPYFIDQGRAIALLRDLLS